MLFCSILGGFCSIIKSILKSTTSIAKRSLVMQLVYPFGLPVRRLRFMKYSFFYEKLFPKGKQSVVKENKAGTYVKDFTVK